MQKRFLLQLIYCVALLLANWFDARLIAFGSFMVDAGTLVFPITYLASDVLTEVYGYKFTRMAIWLGFFANLFFILYGEIIAILPSPAFALANNQSFDHFLQMDMRIIVASLVSYFCAEPLNALLVAKLKIHFKGRAMAARFFGSTLIASFVDTIIFALIAFYGVIPGASLLVFIASIWGAKIIIELMILPASIYLARTLKRVDKVDQYDNNTHFTLFSWDTHYA